MSEAGGLRAEGRRTRWPLRILLIGPAPPPMGGMVRFAQDMIASDLGRWHEITLFPDNIPWTYRPRITTDRFSWNFLRRDGVKVTAKIMAFVGERFLALRRELRDRKPDILHVLSTAGYGFFRNGLHIMLARRRGIPAVFHLLGQIDDLYRDGGWAWRRLVSLCCDLADVHIVQSPKLADFVRTFTRRPVYPIFNGVQMDNLLPGDGYAHSHDGRLRVITVGLLGHRKGTFDLLEAIERLGDGGCAVDFVFVGHGEVDRFRALAAAKRIADRVRFTGEVDDRTRADLIRSSDIFVLPSHAEGQPLALLEAMVAGLPVISSTVGSIPEIVQEGQGFLLPPGDVDGLVRSLRMLLKDPSLRRDIGTRNARLGREKFRLDRVAREIDAVYASLGE